MSRNVRLFGTEQFDAPLRILTAGPLSVAFDNGAIRYVRVGGVEVIRGIAFLVRDENWGTFRPSIEGLSVNERTDGFEVAYRATCKDAKRTLTYDARITGSSDGSLSFEAVADPQTEVLTNRTGFIVLHPIEDLAGKPVRVRYGDGREELSAFPAAIDPRCPFREVTALSHEFVPGAWVTCAMEGDTFEMEDQRNWTDASYKTYVRSLLRPWPYVLPKGEKFRQAIRLSLSGNAPRDAAGGAKAPIRLTLGGAAGKMPRIGTGVTAQETGHALAMPDLVKGMGLKMLVCQIDLRLGQGRAEIDAYKKLAALSGAGIVLEIITQGTLDPAAELAPIGTAVQGSGIRLEAVSVFPQQELKSVQPDVPWPPMPTFEETYGAARQAFPGVTLGGGMASYFTELNRKRPPPEAIDYVTFTSCPAVHAADDVSVMETLEAIPHLIRSTRSFMGKDKPLRIGPSQLGCRENPYGQATTPNPDNGRACLSRIDPRQRGLYNAAWTVGYIAACASEGVDVVTMGELTGPFGHIYRKADFIQPWYDEQNGQLLYPAFHVLAGLANSSGAALSAVTSTGFGKVAAIAVRGGSGTMLWVANLTEETQTIELTAATAGARLAMLDEAGFEQAASDPDFLDKTAKSLTGNAIRLPSYAVARIELPKGN